MATMHEPQHEQRRRNLRLGLILASVALVFFLGFMAKVMMLKG